MTPFYSSLTFQSHVEVSHELNWNAHNPTGYRVSLLFSPGADVDGSIAGVDRFMPFICFSYPAMIYCQVTNKFIDILCHLKRTVLEYILRADII